MTEIIEKTSPDRAAPHPGTTEVRQAVAPHRLRYMLGYGIAGVVIAFVVIYVLFFAS